MYSQKLDYVVNSIKTNTISGLSSNEATARLGRDGKNVLEQKKKKTIFQRFISQFKDTMVIILLFAAFLSLVIAVYNQIQNNVTGGDLLEEYLEAVIIMVIVLLNAVLGTVQEAKAEKSLDALQKLSAPHVRVIRDGKEMSIDAENLVVGDIIKIEAGDIVPADVRLIDRQV